MVLAVIFETVVVVFVNIWVGGEIDCINNELSGIMGSGRLVSFISGLADSSGGPGFFSDSEGAEFLRRDKRRGEG